ncbi:MAG TPA: hypothetical protein VNI20_11685 [Fimbriimonadaceae bacterium]|nr:hypothetical protein [Fimbriimonadaceae bacterium]
MSEKMSAAERQAWSKCVDAAISAMEDLKSTMLRAAISSDPMSQGRSIYRKYTALGVELDRVMAGIGYDDEPTLLDDILDAYAPLDRGESEDF